MESKSKQTKEKGTIWVMILNDFVWFMFVGV